MTLPASAGAGRARARGGRIRVMMRWSRLGISPNSVRRSMGALSEPPMLGPLPASNGRPATGAPSPHADSLRMPRGIIVAGVMSS